MTQKQGDVAVWPATGVSAVALILLLAVALRLIGFLNSTEPDSPDALIYLSAADSLRRGAGLPASAAIYMPLYPVLIAIFGSKGILAVQVLLSSLTPAIVYGLAVEIWRNHKGALVAAIACTLHPSLIFYSHLHLSETVFAFLVASAFFALAKRWIVAGSIAFVLANLCRPSLDYILPLVMIFAALREQRPIFSAIRNLAIYGSIYVVLMSPWWLHNYSVYGRFVRLNLGGGMTAILENSKSFEQHGFDWSVSPPWEAYPETGDPVERDRAMLRDGVRYVVENPGTWALNSIRRFVRMTSPWEVGRGGVNLVLGIVLMSAAYVGLILSVLLNCRRWRHFAPALVAISFLFALHCATHALTRYRLPIDPLIIALSAGVIGRKPKEPHAMVATVRRSS